MLFVRNRAGATLTPAARRFLQHARTLALNIGLQLVRANGGCCFLPVRMAQSPIADGRLSRVNEATRVPASGLLGVPA
jgi:DNA-binding transcriptional LysR family regulator